MAIQVPSSNILDGTLGRGVFFSIPQGRVFARQQKWRFRN